MTARKIQAAIDDALHFLRSRQLPSGAIGQDGYAEGGSTTAAGSRG